MIQWLRVFDAVSNVAQFARGFRKPGQSMPEADVAPGPLAHLETRLAGVVVAALKEAFDRDRARMDLEREHLEAERRRAEQALQAELRRQALERALGQVRLVAMMAVAVWMLSAALGVWLPGMRSGAARALLGAGWACAIGSLGCAFAMWQRIAAHDLADRALAGPGLAGNLAPWLLVAAVALSGAALLAAL